jgi:hypothetical protein
MDPSRMRTAVWVGAIGGVATIVGVALPWLIENTQQPGVSINGLLTGPYVLIFGVVMAAASVFFLTDTDPRKVVAILGPSSLAVLAFVVPIAIDKEAGLFGGISEGSTTERGIGLYVTIVGGVFGLVATAIVVKELMAPTTGATDHPAAFDLGEVSDQPD